ncbi:PepSY domain-containing protein [Algoriphagus sp.]|uniref:PepSY domain-containing protein n=1 Tax=Algoriphagus sp. TaxID=1872435 RepID=UPI00391B4A43
MSDKKFNLRKQLFNWHMWAGVAFAIPVILVSLTAILIAHEKGLGTKKVLVNAGWMPGYQTNEKDLAHYLDDIKAFAQNGEIRYYGTKVGVIEESNQGLTVIAGTEGKEVRDLAFVEAKMLVATKYGLYEINDNQSKELVKGDFHGIQADENRWVASLGKYGIMTSVDQGKTWSEAGKFSENIPSESLAGISSQLVQSGQMEAVALEKLILDIHTGKAFFGEGAMWVWIDLIGLSLLLMTITGIWMWYKRKYGKTSKTTARHQGRVSSPKPIMRPVMKPVLNSESAEI